MGARGKKKNKKKQSSFYSLPPATRLILKNKITIRINKKKRIKCPARSFPSGRRQKTIRKQAENLKRYLRWLVLTGVLYFPKLFLKQPQHFSGQDSKKNSRFSGNVGTAVADSAPTFGAHPGFRPDLWIRLYGCS